MTSSLKADTHVYCIGGQCVLSPWTEKRKVSLTSLPSSSSSSSPSLLPLCLSPPLPSPPSLPPSLPSLPASFPPSSHVPLLLLPARRVAVPDSRFDWLCQYWKPPSQIPAFLHVVDIAGLVKGAHEGQVLYV